MRIRWKLLILMLSISVLPMLIMRSYGQRVIQELGNELASRTRSTLIQETNLSLERLMADHVKAVQREKDVIELALQVQASELEKRLSGPVKTHLGGIFFRSHASDLSAEIQEVLLQPYCRMVEDATCVPLTVTHSDQTIKTSVDADPAAIEASIERISSMTPVYLFLKQAHPDLILWQYTAMRNGVQTVYPAVEYMPLHDLLETEWYREAQALNRLVWGAPFFDPFTRKLCFSASMPIHDSEGEIIGATAVIFPVQAVFRGNGHIRSLSSDITCLLIRPETAPDSQETVIRIIADEARDGHRRASGWRHIGAPRPLRWIPEEELRAIANDLESNEIAVREILHQGRETLAAYGKIASSGTALLMLVPEADIIAEADAMGRYVRKGFEERIRVTGVMMWGIILAVIGLALFLSRYLTQNIRKLDEASQRLAGGDFSVRVDIRNRDEIGQLGAAFNRMVPALAERFQMKQALDVAMHLQQNLLPGEPPRMKGLDIAASCIYCDETGGDFYDFIPVDRGLVRSVGIVVGDVSGHGIPAALLMSSARSFLRCRVAQFGTLSQMISDVNGLVCRDTGDTGHFLTLFYLEISPEAGGVRWVRAGHDPAFLYDPASDAFSELAGKGLALGVDRDYLFSENTLPDVSEGRILLIGTDGIWETENSDEDMFTKDRLRDIIRENAHRSAREITDAVTEGVAAFRGDESRVDDITLVVVKMEGRGSSPKGKTEIAPTHDKDGTE